MKIPIQASSTYSLHEHIGEHTIVGFNTGPSGEVYFVLALDPLDYQTKSDGFASFPKTIPDSSQRYRILCINGGSIELDLLIDNEQFNIHDIQPLANELLLACSRSRYRGPDDFDLNGRVYTRDGTFLRGMLLGDGVNTTQTTHDGEIWAAYFDEGIFGNFGWDEPIGASGLVAWTPKGGKAYEYEADNSIGPISDCYALNVPTSEDVWCYYYTDFPLVHLRNKKIVSVWNTSVVGSAAFAVGHDHVLFAGGYKQRGLFQLVNLGSNGKALWIGEFELHSSSSAPLVPEKVVGRGERLYVLSEKKLYEISLSDVLTKHRGKKL